jgi:G-protein alpha subunit
VFEHAEMITSLDLEDLNDLSQDIPDAIELLWTQNGIKQAFSRKSEYWILEAAEYFFDNSRRFFDTEFAPTEEDIVMARVMTIGIIKTELNYNPLQITLIDGTERHQDRKSEEEEEKINQSRVKYTKNFILFPSSWGTAK